MFLDSKDGISCDHCGTIYKDQFVYYSTRAIKYVFQGRHRSPPQNTDFNTDMCSSCYEKLLDQVRKFIGPNRKDKIKCDLSNTYKSSNFTYYLVYFDRIDVDKKRLEDDTVRADKDVMDLNIIKGFDELLKKTQVIRKKIMEGGWE
jgi:hypothetical protein